MGSVDATRIITIVPSYGARWPWLHVLYLPAYLVSHRQFRSGATDPEAPITFLVERPLPKPTTRAVSRRLHLLDKAFDRLLVVDHNSSAASAVARVGDGLI